jgi:A/G-specific adenine glycosylase
LLIARRPEQGLWGGLWEFPRTQRQGREGLDETAKRAARESLDLMVEPLEVVGQVKHQVTYHAIRLYGYLCQHQSGEARPLTYTDWRWLPLEELPEFPMSVPQRQLAEALQIHGQAEQGSLY